MSENKTVMNGVKYIVPCTDVVFNPKCKKVASEFDVKYLARYVKRVLNDPVTKTEVYNILLDDLMDEETVRCCSESHEHEESTFRLKNIQVFTFPTKTSFVVFEVEHDYETLDEIIKFNYGNVHALTRDYYYIYKKNQKDVKIKLSEVLDYMFDNMEQFPNDARLYAMHKIYNTKTEENWLSHEVLYQLEALSNGYDYVNDDVQRGDELSLMQCEAFPHSYYIHWICSAYGVVNYAMKSQKKFYEDRFQQNILTYYFAVYLLALHERVSLLNYNAKVVDNWKDYKSISKIQDDLIKFDVQFSYNTISEHNNYQNFYEHLYKLMRLEFLEKEVEESCTKIVDQYQAKQQSILEILLGVISVLAFSSFIKDTVDWLEEYWGISFGGRNIFIILTMVALVGFIGYVMYRVHKNQRIQ